MVIRFYPKSNFYFCIFFDANNLENDNIFVIWITTLSVLKLPWGDKNEIYDGYKRKDIFIT